MKDRIIKIAGGSIICASVCENTYCGCCGNKKGKEDETNGGNGNGGNGGNNNGGNGGNDSSLLNPSISTNPSTLKNTSKSVKNDVEKTETKKETDIKTKVKDDKKPGESKKNETKESWKNGKCEIKDTTSTGFGSLYKIKPDEKGFFTIRYNSADNKCQEISYKFSDYLINENVVVCLGADKDKKLLIFLVFFKRGYDGFEFYKEEIKGGENEDKKKEIEKKNLENETIFNKISFFMREMKYKIYKEEDTYKTAVVDEEMLDSPVFDEDFKYLRDTKGGIISFPNINREFKTPETTEGEGDADINNIVDFNIEVINGSIDPDNPIKIEVL